MRVITGKAGGRRLKTLEGLDVRPTSEKVKEAVFSSIQFELEGAVVLDLFCGCGQMGIEALSRGAQLCVFVDSSRASHDMTKENLTATELFKQSRVVLTDYEAFLTSTRDSFDIAFLDPPYSVGLVQKALPLLADKMSESGIILVEHEFCDIMPEAVGEFILKKQYKHGRINISAYRHR